MHGTTDHADPTPRVGAEDATPPPAPTEQKNTPSPPPPPPQPLFPAAPAGVVGVGVEVDVGKTTSGEAAGDEGEPADDQREVMRF